MNTSKSFVSTSAGNIDLSMIGNKETQQMDALRYGNIGVAAVSDSCDQYTGI